MANLNNNAEDEFQLNITAAESSPENVNGHLDSTGPECEINLHEDIDKKNDSASGASKESQISASTSTSSSSSFFLSISFIPETDDSV
jgi:hypothetical protein